jgi:hypothetical protein
MTINSTEIEALIRDFTTRVVTAVHVQVGARVLAVVTAALTGSGLPGVAPSKPVKHTQVVAGNGRRKIKLTAKGLAARQLQGKYLGVIRALPMAARARVKKVAHEKGVAAAIKFAAALK